MKRTCVEEISGGEEQHDNSTTVLFQIEQGELSEDTLHLIMNDIRKVATQGALTIQIESTQKKTMEAKEATNTQKRVIQAILKDNRLTMRDAAKMFSTSPVTINNLRHGKGQMHRKTAKKILEAVSRNILILSKEARNFLQSRI